MSARLRGIAKQTEGIVERGRYTAPGGREVSITGAVAAAMEGTALFGPEPVPVPEPEAGADPTAAAGGADGTGGAAGTGDPATRDTARRQKRKT